MRLANAVLSVAAKLPIPDDRAYWGRWADGILDIDGVQKSTVGSFGALGPVFGFGTVTSEETTTMSSERPKVGDEDPDDNDEFLLGMRALARGRAWVLMGTAINEGTSEIVRDKEEKEAKDALRKGEFWPFVLTLDIVSTKRNTVVYFLEDARLHFQNILATTTSRSPSMSMSISNETVMPGKQQADHYHEIGYQPPSNEQILALHQTTISLVGNFARRMNVF